MRKNAIEFFFIFQRKRFSLLINLELVIVLRRVTLRYEYHGFTHFFILYIYVVQVDPYYSLNFVLVLVRKLYIG